MRILLTNNTLANRAGTELYVRDVAVGLLKRGHQPVCFSLVLGEVADELRSEGVEVVDGLSPQLGTFDVIHGQHHIETTLAALVFPRVPVVSFCHGPKAWQERSCTMPNVVRYVAVDEACRQRLVDEGIAADDIEVLLNFADTHRFKPRSPLPARPKKALVFSNNASERSHLPVIETACARHGVEVDVAGRDSGRPADRPEHLLPAYDLVFAKGRAAIEAMAVGCAVIQCDFFGAGRLITSDLFDDLRPMNFGWESMGWDVSVEHLSEQVAAYNAEDAASVCQRIREEANLDLFLLRLLELYEAATSQPVMAFDPWQVGRMFFAEVVASAKEGRALDALRRDCQALSEANDALNEANHELNAINDTLLEQNQALLERLRKVDAEPGLP